MSSDSDTDYDTDEGYDMIGDPFRELSKATLLEISRNNPDVTALKLKDTWIEGAGEAISQSKTLTSIAIRFRSSEREEGWLRDLCRGVARNRSITRFDMSVFNGIQCRDVFRILSPCFFSRLHCIKLYQFPSMAGPMYGIDDVCISVLSIALTQSTTIELLEISGNLSLSPSGWRTLSSGLSHPNCSLESLRLNYSSSIGDGVLTCLGFALESSNLQYVEITSISRTISSTGWGFFATCLKNPKCALNTLIIEECDIDDDGASNIVSVLPDNARLESLYMRGNYELRRKDWSDLALVLCDKTSIENTYSSNHTLNEFEFDWLSNDEADFDFGIDEDEGDGGDRDDDEEDWTEADRAFISATWDEIEMFLSMNQNQNKAEVARLKIMKHHFPRGEINAPVFASMVESAMPHAIEWIVRSNDHTLSNLELTVMYNFVQNFPELFDTHGGSQSSPAKRRKHS